MFRPGPVSKDDPNVKGYESFYSWSREGERREVFHTDYVIISNSNEAEPLYRYHSMISLPPRSIAHPTIPPDRPKATTTKPSLRPQGQAETKAKSQSSKGEGQVKPALSLDPTNPNHPNPSRLDATEAQALEKCIQMTYLLVVEVKQSYSTLKEARQEIRKEQNVTSKGLSPEKLEEKALIEMKLRQQKKNYQYCRGALVALDEIADRMGFELCDE